MKASNAGNGDRFGWSVALHGARAIVGAFLEQSCGTGANPSDTADGCDMGAGAAYTFARNNATDAWLADAYLKAGPGKDQQTYFGYAVDVHSNTCNEEYTFLAMKYYNEL